MTTDEFTNKIIPVKDKIFRLARRILNNAEDAEDLVQEVFVKIWSKDIDISSMKNIEAFMMVVTKNLCLDKIRAGGQQKIEVDESKFHVSFASPDKMLELKDEVTGVHQIISQLPLMQQMIVQMRDVEGLDFEEMEEILQINANAIRVNLSRARKAIRDQLTKKHDYEYQGNKNIG